MVTKFQAEVDKLLECSVCLEEFKQPKMLKCQHSFCFNPCLKNMSKKVGPNGGFLTVLQCKEYMKHTKYQICSKSLSTWFLMTEIQVFLRYNVHM